MDTSDLLSRISIDPNICFGKPRVRGHRIWVSLVHDVATVVEQSMMAASDSTLIEHCRDEGRALVTMDLDFCPASWKSGLLD